jgi:hypothetical protein
MARLDVFSFNHGMTRYSDWLLHSSPSTKASGLLSCGETPTGQVLGYHWFIEIRSIYIHPYPALQKITWTLNRMRRWVAQWKQLMFWFPHTLEICFFPLKPLWWRDIPARFDYQLATTCYNSDDIPHLFPSNPHRQVLGCRETWSHPALAGAFFAAGTFGRLFMDAYGFVWIFTHNLTVNGVNFVKEME